jgi:uncharacterized protein YjbI with pentapeptide repeats
MPHKGAGDRCAKQAVKGEGMEKYTGTKFSNSEIEVDGNQYNNCNFAKCKLVYRGGKIPIFRNSNFDECSWYFADEAGNTLTFVRSMIRAGGGFRDVVFDTLLRE